ncbi:MAG TPA: hypothetical protein VGV37_05790 [Aliidongia sp.]|uniref:hypothetical protein n=1 Tax=Aliidongia sp. TaxID=1914230 RepID=UPI002DDCBF5E|nr:hypothetical protein [Aliidongia sp.]HEV2674035.1 hypothetical protein [Aliidongia sp.]
MASISAKVAVLAITGLMAGGALAQTPSPAAHTSTSTLQQTGAPSDDTTPPGTGAADLPHGPIVNGKQLQPRPSAPPSRQDAQRINQMLQQTPTDPAANGPIVQPHDLFGNPLGGSPNLDPKKP